MSWDDSTTDYHLTPAGWVTGNRPADAVESWKRSTSQQSGWSKENIDWWCVWADQKIARGERDSLRKRHREFMGVPGRRGNIFTSIGEPL